MKTKILFVCSSNVDRSKTAEDLYKADERFEVKSCGVDPNATTLVTRDLVNWADVIVAMDEKEDRHIFKLYQQFPYLKPMKKNIVDLDIPDNYLRGDPELIKLIKERMSQHFPEEHNPIFNSSTL